MLGSIIRLRSAKNRNALFSESHSRPGETGSLEVPLRGPEEGEGEWQSPRPQDCDGVVDVVMG